MCTGHRNYPWHKLICHKNPTQSYFVILREQKTLLLLSASHKPQCVDWHRWQKASRKCSPGNRKGFALHSSFLVFCCTEICVLHPQHIMQYCIAAIPSSYPVIWKKPQPSGRERAMGQDRCDSATPPFKALLKHVSWAFFLIFFMYIFRK